MKTIHEYIKLVEATKTKTKSKVNLAPDLEPPADYPVAAEPKKPEQPKQQAQAPELRKATQARTQQATQGLATDRMGDVLSRMRNIEPDLDDPGYPEPETTTDLVVRVDTDNLPAIANKQLTQAGVQNPEFHQVANLPGNMSRAIRTLGRQLFRSLTTTPTDDIWMIANLGGMGPNTSLEVNSVANWVRKNGKDLGSGDIDFDTTIPGYTAEIHQYSAGGIRWLLVRDEFGTYIYSWPEDTSVQHKNKPEIK